MKYRLKKSWFYKKYKFQVRQAYVLGGQTSYSWQTLGYVNSIFEIRRLGFENTNKYRKKINFKKRKDELHKILETTSVPVLPKSKYLTSQFTTEYAIYDEIDDKIIIQVISQGYTSPYYMVQSDDSYRLCYNDVVELNDIYMNPRYKWLGLV